MAERLPKRTSSIPAKHGQASARPTQQLQRQSSAPSDAGAAGLQPPGPARPTNGARALSAVRLQEEEELEDVQLEQPKPEPPPLQDIRDAAPSPDLQRTPSRARDQQALPSPTATSPAPQTTFSEWSHQNMAPQPEALGAGEDDEDADGRGGGEDEWQEMPSLAPFDIYDDAGKLVARESAEEGGGPAPDPDAPPPAYQGMGGAARGYTRVQVDEDARSATSMDENTAYLFKEVGNSVQDDYEEMRDVSAQMQTTKQILNDTQRMAYVGLVKISTADMRRELGKIERTRGSKKELDLAVEALSLWSQKMMVRLYRHMELESAEQIMIEQLAVHSVTGKDLTPTLLASSRVKNPVGPDADAKSPPNGEEGPSAAEGPGTGSSPSTSTSKSKVAAEKGPAHPSGDEDDSGSDSEPLPAYRQRDDSDGSDDDESKVPPVQDGAELLDKEVLDIDLRWTILCDLFLVLISDSMYDARSRVLLETVAAYLDITWLDVCRFEKRVTEALEMEEEAQKEDWNEAEHMEQRRKRARNRRLALMGLATVGGGLVIGLTAGLMAPLIGAGLAAGFTTIGVSGTGTFLAGAGGAAVIGTIGTATGGITGVRAANRRTGAVRTFEYRPLHNNKRVNLILTVAGWMNGKVDDVRLPFSTIDPVMGDIYSVLWEPEMLRSMGDTINILATEALTQGLQQILGSTILITLMAALQAPILLTKLSYLIDNPWSVSLARAEMAGLILADSLTDRNLGARPITLVGFSLGSKVIFSCLKELAKKGALGLVQNVYLFGSPVVANRDEYLRVRTVVSGRFVNGYATNDWILGYLFRATSGGLARVAGLAEVKVPSIENFNVTEFVPGHMSYRKSMPRLLREVGWLVESDEFSEIEDPDPENHEKRQRELINEIEEARKELESHPEKRRFGIFKRNKKLAKKKDWETYDERIKAGPDAASSSSAAANGAGGDAYGALFDIEAIRREAAELAAEGIQIRELKSTMPPMRIDPALLSADSSPRTSVGASRDGSRMSLPLRPPASGGSRAESPAADARYPKSTGDWGAPPSARSRLEAEDESRESDLARVSENVLNSGLEVGGAARYGKARRSRPQHDFADDGDISMSFEPSGDRSWGSARDDSPPPAQAPAASRAHGSSSSRSHSPLKGGWGATMDEPAWGATSNGHYGGSDSNNLSVQDLHSNSAGSYNATSREPPRAPQPASRQADFGSSQRPAPVAGLAATSAGSAAASSGGAGAGWGNGAESSSGDMASGNVWADEEEYGFGKEEVNMTFE